MNSTQAQCFEELTKFLNKQGALEQVMTPSIVNLVFNVVLTLTASVGNSLINCAIFTTQNLQTPSYLLITSLAFTDLLVGLVYHPLQTLLMVHILNKNAKGVCQIISIYSFVITFLSVLSFLMVALISIDRNLAFNLRQRYRITVTKRRVRLVIYLGWMFSLPFGFSSIFLQHQVHVPTLISFLGLLLLSTICFYVNAYRGLRHIGHTVHPPQPNQLQSTFNVLKYRKTLKTMVIVLVCLLLCFAPFICSLVVIVSYGVSTATITFAFACLTLLALHSSINPVIYIIGFRDIRRQVRKQILDNLCHH
ncbi:melanocyte-stimulating hormone receptor-like [Actinia tenebrosa]|uniref:Melanocyte-stimulating hormone receptor-like n=1 Tax=Actinia tenebrosa TaxID=6105 RepID=A0A6P8HI65_ACTTE|nr:melanocyte-stimulating hormone receptor-like [Actinia tenebrosa]